jgi:hypothetical protein
MIALRQVDLLGTWYQHGEWRTAYLGAGLRRAAAQRSIEPYYHVRPWSRLLEGRRVLVVSSFAASVERQYRNRRSIWPDRDVLPEFHLETLKVPFSAGIARPPYLDWFDALDHLRELLASKEFDVALVGAGAWSLPLTAHAKELGRIGIHLGGATQVLFGIKGARWDSHPVISSFYNSAWQRPDQDERPESISSVENGCYW